MAVTIFHQRFSTSYYSQRAILEAVHEISSQFVATAEEVNNEHVVSIEGVDNDDQREAVRLWLTQLVNDAELRARIEESLGRVRDVVIAAAFSKIVEVDPSESPSSG